jgi:hypothetical protein
MTAPDEEERPPEVIELGGSVRSSGTSVERTARETRVSFARRSRVQEISGRPSQVELLLSRLERERRVLLAGAAATAVLLLVATAGWVFNQPVHQPEPPVAAAAVDTGGLSQDQAICAAFSRIQGEVAQSMIERYNVGRPPSRQLFRKEVVRLDALAADYPAAHYRLVAAFAAVADYVATLLHGLSGSDQHGTTPGYTTLATAHRVCLDIAGYDTASATVITAGHPPPSAAAQARVDAQDK